MSEPATEITRVLISIIVPCLNERRTIGPILAQLLETGPDVEIIVVDGGSSDGTPELLRHARIRLLETRPGRGHQLDAGARTARGEMLWFLHADTIISREAEAELRNACADRTVRSGNFSLRFDGTTRGARVMTTIYRYLRWIGLSYGDSAYFVRADVYREAGGFLDYPIFEDLDLLRRLRRGGSIRAIAGGRNDLVAATGEARFSAHVRLLDLSAGALLAGVRSPATGQTLSRGEMSADGDTGPVLVLVYNADSGFFNALADSAHKLLSPSTYACPLCALTYNSLTMRREWAQFLEGLPLAVRFLHRDECRAQYPHLNVKLPAVLIVEHGSPRVLIEAGVVRTQLTLTGLKNAVARAVSAAIQT